MVARKKTEPFENRYRKWVDRNPIRAWRNSFVPVMSQTQAGLKIGVSRATVAGWESCEWQPTSNTLGEIAAATGMRDIRTRWAKWYEDRPL